MIRVKVDLPKAYNPQAEDKVIKQARRQFKEVVTDLRDVSQSLTPRLSGNLERSVTSRVTYKNGEVTGYVRYRAQSPKGYNYAKKMHDTDYKLGKESRKKRAIKSRFAFRTLTVGRDYLSKPAEMSREGYVLFLEKKMTEALNSSQLFKKGG